ncbi:MAG: hypothetical protein CMC76_04300 [Flavobacteriaceae bacterium]|uniref:hypothetical protein n=1 Tax=Winogradskyella sp. SYSU M77433 TaxID=3042722 RepID=UPI000C385157|nr:hypothetical protein [Winogradskyella sp. SYSU M77433]MAX70310.1 hypothetical protein [Flavobacteriaceae bacterium]MDH7911783.1 hypothetical protein [Winogradskyella sp. SYSU M77433]
MISHFNFTKKELLSAGIFFAILGCIAINSQNISSYLIDAYNHKVEYLANNTVASTNILRY